MALEPVFFRLRLESLKPMISTSDLMEQRKRNREYAINVSHSARNAGLYDSQIAQYRQERVG